MQTTNRAFDQLSGSEHQLANFGLKNKPEHNLGPACSHSAGYSLT